MVLLVNIVLTDSAAGPMKSLLTNKTYDTTGALSYEKMKAAKTANTKQEIIDNAVSLAKHKSKRRHGENDKNNS